MTRAALFAELSEVAWREAEEAARNGQSAEFQRLVDLSDALLSQAETLGWEIDAA